MPPSRPKLSVAIPTYNRNRVLFETVSELLRFSPEEVEIVVSDNGSDIPVEDTLSPLLSQHPGRSITIHRNIQNLGVSANLLRCYEKAHGEWIWLLGDDDQLHADSVYRVLAECKLATADTALIDFGHPFTAHTRERLTVSGMPEIIRELYYPDGKPEIFRWSDGHISNEVCRLDLMLPHLQTGYKYAGTLYPHVAVIFAALQAGSSATLTGPVIASVKDGRPESANKQHNHIQMAFGWATLAEMIEDDTAREQYLDALARTDPYGLSEVFRPSRASYDTLSPLAKYRRRIHAARLAVDDSPQIHAVLEATFDSRDHLQMAQWLRSELDRYKASNTSLKSSSSQLKKQLGKTTSELHKLKEATAAWNERSWFSRIFRKLKTPK